MNPDHLSRLREAEARMRSPETADNYDVRKEILARIKSGEITLAQGQAELNRIQNKAKRDGKPTAY